MTVETMSVRRFGLSTVSVAIGSLVLGTLLSMVLMMPLVHGVPLTTFLISSLFMGVVAMISVSLIYVFSALTMTIIAYSEGEITS